MMRESLAHYRWRHDRKPDRYYDVTVFNVDPATSERVDVRTARFAAHTPAELWLIAHLTSRRPFGEGIARRVREVDRIELDDGLFGVGIAFDEPDGWCWLDNAADDFVRQGRWLPAQLGVDLD